MSNAGVSFDEIKRQANGNWSDIFEQLNIDVGNGRHQACPSCGGKDRFKFDDKNGGGTWFCNQCEPKSGDGFNLIQNVEGCTAAQSKDIVLSIVGAPMATSSRSTNKNKGSSESDVIAATATFAQSIWVGRVEINDHPYMLKKGLAGIVVSTSGGEHMRTFNDDKTKNRKTEKIRSGSLIVPYYRRSTDKGEPKICQIEYIDGNGSKRFLTGRGTKKGAWHRIDGHEDLICVGEGFATAMTVNLMVGAMCLVAGGSGSVPSVFEDAVSRYPGGRYFLLTDNDEAGSKIEKRYEKDCRVRSVSPPDDSCNDWNDYFQRHGEEKTREELNRQLVDFRERTASSILDSSIDADQDESVCAHSQLSDLCDDLNSRATENLPSKDEVANLATSVINHQYCMVLNGANALVIKESFDDTGKAEIQYIAPTQLQKWGANRRLAYKNDGGDRKQCPAYRQWESHSDRRTYDSVTFSPNRITPSCFNLWRGFNIEPVYTDGHPKIKRFLSHLLDNVCDGNEGNYEYFITWIACLFQMPEKKPDVAVVLRSKDRGTGKSKIAEVLSRLIGFHCVKVSNTKHLTGSFNAHLQTALLVHVEESFWAGNPSDAGIIRDLITSHTIAIERKGVDVVEIQSYHRFMMITNNDWAVPASYDERRFFVLDVANHQKQNRDYFAALTADLEGGGYEELMDYFMGHPIERDINVVPRTSGLQNQIIMGLEPHEKFWLDCLHNKNIGFIDISETGKWGIASRDLYDEYLEFSRRMSVRIPLTDRQLGKQVRKMCPSRGGTRKKFGAGDRRSDGYEYPKLDKCRTEFEEGLGLDDFDWND